jgi:hypothetical protein
MYYFRRTAYSASLKIEAQVPPEPQLPNLHSIITQKTAILTMKMPLLKAVVSKVIFKLARRIKKLFFMPQHIKS